jgi:hypothetical protein
VKERIPFELFVRTVLELRHWPQYERCSEEELVEAACVFLDRLRSRYHVYAFGRHEHWTVLASRRPLIELKVAARNITGERTYGKALSALDGFLGRVASPEMMLKFKEYGGMNKDYCEKLRLIYRDWRLAFVREKQSQAGRKTKNLKKLS